ncbi:hypothetical protein D0Z07_7405 [Hyphodiscus hymeniophilus]|uniref:Uncharacterized protein n=1 Tax=Hyphodiscus hymeniophilus TaxID=353542 RepID=A0A9P6VF05_9HELO|nr:hypothetical protein D0Z07_7405 [Hyphodiscus hymeniophilus]
MSDPSNKLLDGYRDSFENATDNSSDAGLETDFEKGGLQRQTSTHAKIQKWLLYTVTAFILGSLFYTMGLYTRVAISRAPMPESRTFGSCGNDTISALQNGCILDLMSEAWVHPDCYDQELETEFLSLSDWHWYADQAGDHELTIEEIRATGGPDPIRELYSIHLLQKLMMSFPLMFAHPLRKRLVISTSVSLSRISEVEKVIRGLEDDITMTH